MQFVIPSSNGHRLFWSRLAHNAAGMLLRRTWQWLTMLCAGPSRRSLANSAKREEDLFALLHKDLGARFVYRDENTQYAIPLAGKAAISRTACRTFDPSMTDDGGRRSVVFRPPSNKWIYLVLAIAHPFRVPPVP
jgi:hypothetical protein